MSKKPTLAELRAKFKQKAEGKREFTGNSDVYPFWNIAENATATVRILPDLNEDNENYFYVEKLEHKLAINGKDRKIPCVKMYGEKCPICALSSAHYKADKAAGKKDSVDGKYYYFKRTALMKALIIKDPIDHAESGGESAEGQVKTLQFSYQLMKLITAAISNEEEEKALEELPWDMEAGYNFLIQKTKQGQYDSYSTSAFSNRVSAIPEKYMDAVEEGRIDLSTLLPENPGLEKVQALLEAHLSGSDLDEEEEVDENPVIVRRRQPTQEDDDLPPRRASVAPKREEEEEEEELPVRKRKVVEEDEEIPTRKRKVVVEEEEEEIPARKRKVVVEEEEEEERPVRKSKPVVEEEEDEDEDEDAMVARIRARKPRSE